MPDLSDEARAALRYWPQIEEAAALRMTTQDLWNTINDAAEEAGLASPGATLRGVSELRGLATAIQTSAGRLNSARATDAILAEHMAESPRSRPQAQAAALGIYLVRFQHTTIGAEGPETQWRTSVFRGALPPTIGELREAVEGDAQMMADKYGVSHVDLGGMQLLWA